MITTLRTGLTFFDDTSSGTTGPFRFPVAGVDMVPFRGEGRRKGAATVTVVRIPTTREGGREEGKRERQTSHDNASLGALTRMFKNVTSFALAQMNSLKTVTRLGSRGWLGTELHCRMRCA